MRLLDLLPEKLSARIEPSPECWGWRGWHNNLGYGYVRWEKRDRPAHRVVMEILNGGPFTPGTDIDHLCRNPGCVNPDHLEPVPHQVNIRRGRAGTKTACTRGHDWSDPKNVYRRRDGRRWCAACNRERWT